VDPSASPGPGRGSESLSSGRDTDGRRTPGTGGGLPAKFSDEEPPIRLEISEGEDVTSGDVPREERGLAGPGGPCDAWRGGGDERGLEVRMEGG